MTTQTRTHADIDHAARQIAGAIWDDYYSEGSLANRLRRCAEWSNLGTDGDLTDADRAALRTLADDADAAVAALETALDAIYAINAATDDIVVRHPSRIYGDGQVDTDDQPVWLLSSEDAAREAGVNLDTLQRIDTGD